MQLMLCACSQGRSEDTHMPVLVFLMQEEYDDELAWPFQGEVTVRLVNQAGSVGQIVY